MLKDEIKRNITKDLYIEKRELGMLADKLEIKDEKVVFDIKSDKSWGVLLPGIKREDYKKRNRPIVRNECNQNNGYKTISNNDEERIIKCWYYCSNGKCSDDCKNEDKYGISKDSEFTVKNYQIPMDYNKIEHVGKIDLVLEDKKNKTLYAVEVKRKDGKSRENIVRMIAEILTYTTVTHIYHYGDDNKFNEKGPEMIPAIGLFYKKPQHKNSAIGLFDEMPQYKNYKDLRKDENLKKIIDSTKLKVFLFTDPGRDESGVHEMDIKMLNPDTM